MNIARNINEREDVRVKQKRNLLCYILIIMLCFISACDNKTSAITNEFLAGTWISNDSVYVWKFDSDGTGEYYPKAHETDSPHLQVTYVITGNSTLEVTSANSPTMNQKTTILKITQTSDGWNLTSERGDIFTKNNE